MSSIKGFHLFVCSGNECESEASCLCDTLSDMSLLDYVCSRVEARGLNAEVSCAGCCHDCTQGCERGPVMLVHPNGWWYGGLNENKVDSILEALRENRVVDEYLVN